MERTTLKRSADSGGTAGGTERPRKKQKTVSNESIEDAPEPLIWRRCAVTSPETRSSSRSSAVTKNKSTQLPALTPIVDLSTLVKSARSDASIPSTQSRTTLPQRASVVANFIFASRPEEEEVEDRPSDIRALSSTDSALSISPSKSAHHTASPALALAKKIAAPIPTPSLLSRDSSSPDSPWEAPLPSPPASNSPAPPSIASSSPSTSAPPRSAHKPSSDATMRIASPLASAARPSGTPPNANATSSTSNLPLAGDSLSAARDYYTLARARVGADGLSATKSEKKLKIKATKLELLAAHRAMQQKLDAEVAARKAVEEKYARLESALRSAGAAPSDGGGPGLRTGAAGLVQMNAALMEEQRVLTEKLGKEVARADAVAEVLRAAEEVISLQDQGVPGSEPAQDGVRGRLEEVESQLAMVREEKATLEAALAAQQPGTSDGTEELEALREENRVLKEAAGVDKRVLMERLEKEIATRAVAERMQQMDSELATSQKKIIDIGKKLEDALTAALEKKESELAAVQEEKGKLERALVAQREVVLGRVKEYTERIMPRVQELNRALAAAEVGEREAKEVVRRAEAEVESLRRLNEALQSELVSLKAELEGRTKELSQVKQESESTRRAQSELEAHNTALNDGNKSMAATVALLKAQNETQGAVVERLEEERDAMERSRDALQARNDTFEMTRDALSAEIASLKAGNEQQHGALVRANEEAESMRRSMEDAEAQVKTLKRSNEALGVAVASLQREKTAQGQVIRELRNASPKTGTRAVARQTVRVKAEPIDEPIMLSVGSKKADMIDLTLDRDDEAESAPKGARANANTISARPLKSPTNARLSEGNVEVDPSQKLPLQKFPLPRRNPSFARKQQDFHTDSSIKGKDEASPRPLNAVPSSPGPAPRRLSDAQIEEILWKFSDSNIACNQCEVDGLPYTLPLNTSMADLATHSETRHPQICDMVIRATRGMDRQQIQNYFADAVTGH